MFSWDNFERHDKPQLSSVEDIPNRQFTTSGRAAIHKALMLLRLKPGDAVLVPTYHCPTMIAPVILAGGTVEYYGITAEGLPNLAAIPTDLSQRAAAILVPHYFGLPKSLAEVRHWCDTKNIALIEDCAHSLYGDAGERPVGTWGDFATVSLSKFLPIPEGGLLVSNIRPFTPHFLEKQGVSKQIKGVLDVLHVSTLHRRLTGLNTAIGSLFSLKSALRRTDEEKAPGKKPIKSDFMLDCDMGRISFEPLLISKLISYILPRSRIISRRQDNYKTYASLLQLRNHSKFLNINFPENSAPYVFPFWVDDPDRIYHSLRLAGYPVFRWDRIWPGAPALKGDVGPLWSRHVLQLLCHQDLSPADITKTANAVIQLIDAPVGN